jgi:hypothetical protein
MLLQAGRWFAWLGGPAAPVLRDAVGGDLYTSVGDSQSTAHVHACHRQRCLDTWCVSTVNTLNLCP